MGLFSGFAVNKPLIRRMSRIMDVYGKVLLSKSFSEIAIVDIGGLPAGIYVLGLKDEGAISRIFKVVKE